jgi:hypothetical protein
MMSKQRLKLLIFTIALTLVANAAGEIVPAQDVQEVKPILDLCAEATGSEGKPQNAVVWQTGQLMGVLFQMKTKASDEALVILMNFYVGESLGEDLLHQVTVRGKRMLPLLLKYRSAHVIFSSRRYPSSLLLAPDVRKENFSNAINSVKEKRVLGED